MKILILYSRTALVLFALSALVGNLQAVAEVYHEAQVEHTCVKRSPDAVFGWKRQCDSLQFDKPKRIVHTQVLSDENRIADNSQKGEAQIHPAGIKKTVKKAPLVVLTPDEFKEKILDKHEKIKQRQNATLMGDVITAGDLGKNNPKAQNSTLELGIQRTTKEMNSSTIPTEVHAEFSSETPESEQGRLVRDNVNQYLETNTQPSRENVDSQDESPPTSSPIVDSSNTANDEPRPPQSPDSKESILDKSIGHGSTSTEVVHEVEDEALAVMKDEELLEDLSDGLSENEGIETSDHDGSNAGEEDGVRFNYAALDAGAIMMAANPDSKGKSNLLFENRDKYWLNPCDKRGWVVVGLSEEVLVDTIVMANFEKYSSSYKAFQVLGAKNYPVNEWMLMGEFQAEPGNTEQTFRLPEPGFARYLKFRFLTHYGNEFYCTLSVIRVHGDSMIENFRESYQKSSDAVNEFRETIKLALDEDEVVTNRVLEVSSLTVDSYARSEDEEVDRKNLDANSTEPVADLVEVAGNEEGRADVHVEEEIPQSPESIEDKVEPNRSVDDGVVTQGNKKKDDLSVSGDKLDSDAAIAIENKKTISNNTSTVVAPVDGEYVEKVSFRTLFTEAIRQNSSKPHSKTWVTELYTVEHEECPPDFLKSHSSFSLTLHQPTDLTSEQPAHTYLCFKRVSVAPEDTKPSSAIASVVMVPVTGSVQCPKGYQVVPNKGTPSPTNPGDLAHALCFSTAEASELADPVMKFEIVSIQEGKPVLGNNVFDDDKESAQYRIVCTPMEPLPFSLCGMRLATDSTESAASELRPGALKPKETPQPEADDGQSNQPVPPPSGSPVMIPPGRKMNSMDNIFSTLTTKIQELEIDQSLFKRYLEDVNGKYAVVFGDLQEDIDQVMNVADTLAVQIKNLSAAGDAAMEASKERAESTEELISRMKAELQSVKAQLGYTEGAIADLALLVIVSSIVSSMLAALLTASCVRSRHPLKDAASSTARTPLGHRSQSIASSRSRTTSESSLFANLENAKIRIPTVEIPDVDLKLEATGKPDLSARAEALASPTKRPRLNEKERRRSSCAQIPPATKGHAVDDKSKNRKAPPGFQDVSTQSTEQIFKQKGISVNSKKTDRPRSTSPVSKGWSNVASVAKGALRRFSRSNSPINS